MTPVLMEFLTSTGQPLGMANVEIRLSRSDFDEEVSGIIMPRLINAVTGLDGKLLIDLMPCDSRYHVTVYDTVSDTALHYHFYVPHLNTPGTIVRLQDLIVADDAVIDPVSYDVTAMLTILDAKANVLAAISRGELARDRAEAAAQFADDSIMATVDARNAAQTAALQAQVAAAQIDIDKQASHDSALLAEDHAAAALQSKTDAAASASASLASATAALNQATAAAQSAFEADQSEATAVAARDTATGAAASAVAARDSTLTARDGTYDARDNTYAARDVAVSARDTAIQKSNQLAAQLAAFNEIYIGKFAVPPTVDGNGNALKVGAIYENTVEGKIYQWESDLAWHAYDEESQLQLNNATLAASNAAASATAATNMATNAANSSTAAAQSAVNAASSLTAAAQSATDALASKNAAAGSATAADTARATAVGAKDTATQKAADAAQSAADAAEAAALATFGQIPADWTQTDPVNKGFIKNKPLLSAVATSGNKVDIGLSNVDNTSDDNKPVSTAQQAALNTKENLTSKDNSDGYPGLSGFKLTLKNAAGSIASYLLSVSSMARYWTLPDKDGTIALLSDITGTNSGTNTGDETAATIRTKLGATVVTGSNTGDETQSSLLTKIGTLPIANGGTGSTTAGGALANLGLSQVQNTSDLNKPISTATQAALNTKAAITYVDAKVAALVASSPAALDTLNKLATSLGNDPSFATTMINNLAGKVDKVTLAGNNDLNSMVDSGFYRVENLNPNLIHPYSPVIVSRGSNTAAQISINYGNGTMAVRGARIVDNPSESLWTPWRTILADHNYNSYAPTLTGAGASGTWNININGTSGNSLALNGAVLRASPDGSSVVKRTTEGYIIAKYLNTDQALETSPIASVYTNNGIDGYLRKSDIDYFTSKLAGTAPISITGGASYHDVFDASRDAGAILPNAQPHRVRWDFVSASTAGNSSAVYSGLMTLVPYDGTTAGTGGSSYQLAFSSNVHYGAIPDLKIRNGADTTWNNWYTLWHSGNLVPSSNGEPGTVALLDAAGNVNAQGIIVRQTTGVGQGVQLYPSTASGMPNFGISFAKLEYFGGHGTLNGDWSTYLTMDSQAGRGWIFKTTGVGNVASIDNQGNATFNLDVKANRYNYAAYHNSTDEGVNGTAGTVTGILTKRGDDFHRTTNAYSVKTFLSPVFLDKGTFASGTVAVVASGAEHQKITASGNITLTLAGFRAAGKTDELLLECVNFGGKTIGFPTINWVKSDGSFTTAFASNGVTLQASGTDFILIWTHDGGTTLFGKVMR